MNMNPHTATVLDYTLIQAELQSYAVTPMGKALAVALQPHTDAAILTTQLQETSEIVTLMASGDEPLLAPVVDLQPLLETAHIGGFYLEGTQLLEVAACLEVLQRLRRYAHGDTQRAPLLSRRLTRLADFNILLRQLRTALDDKGYVRDHASPALQQIRRTLAHTRERVQQTLRGLMASHSAVVQDAVVTIRNNRFVIPLKTDFRQALRGIVHGESASGATVYVEPDSVVDLNNHLLHTQAAEERAVRDVLRQLTEWVAVQRVAIEQAVQILGDVDLLLAKGRLSCRMQGIAPQLTSQPQIQLLEARHPFLSDPVPIDVHLGPQDRTLVITGPNTGGKTAILKTVGLLSLMAQAGLHIPARAASKLPIFSDIFVDIGDEQSLQQNLSTFSAHLSNIRHIMAQASPQTLVLLDELGAGTDPMEGGPLGIAILDYIHSRCAMTLTTTHHSAIKAFAMSAPQVACAAVDFDLDTLQPRYKLVYGLPGRSKAFAIAEKLGLPATVITHAQAEAGMTHVRSDTLLARLEVERQAMETERQRLADEQAESQRLHSQAQQTFAQAAAEEQRIRQGLYAEGQTLIKSARHDLDTLLGTLRRQTSGAAAFPHEDWQRAVQTLATLAPAAAEPVAPPASLQVGDQVRIRSLNIVGQLRTPVAGNNTVQVEVGNKTLTVSAAELERATQPQPETPAPTRPRDPRPALTESPLATDLYVRGATVAEALPLVEKYLDQAFMQGLPRLRIIHGIGSGRLREGIIELLGHHPLVRRFQSGDAGGGTTIVELEG
jgi:DNA mismatch repair protein MutS2